MKYTWLDLLRQLHTEDLEWGEAKGNAIRTGWGWSGKCTHTCFYYRIKINTSKEQNLFEYFFEILMLFLLNRMLNICARMRTFCIPSSSCLFPLLLPPALPAAFCLLLHRFLCTPASPLSIWLTSLLSASAWPASSADRSHLHMDDSFILGSQHFLASVICFL